jgi:hypothetical protein
MPNMFRRKTQDKSSTKFQIARETTEGRRYQTFHSIQEFEDFRMNSRTEKHFNEIISDSNDYNQYLYFDLDWDDTISHANVLKTLIEGLEAYYVDFNKDSLRILDSSNDSKNSLHIIIKDKVFRNAHECRQIAEKIKLGYCPEVDMIYNKNRCFRILGSSKLNDPSRVFKPVNLQHSKKEIGLSHFPLDPLEYYVNTMHDDYYYPEPLVMPENTLRESLRPKEQTKAIRLFRDKAPDAENHSEEPAKIRSARGGVELTFKRLRPSHCVFCDRTHDRINSAAVVVYDNGKTFLYCHRSTQEPIFLGPEDEKATPTRLQSAIDAVDVLQSMDRLTDQFNKVGELKTYNKKYCAHKNEIMESKAPIIAQRASMGTGKTFVANQRVSKLNENDRCLVLSFRRSLSAQYKNSTFAGHDFKLYMEEKELTNDISKLIISPESLHRLRWSGSKDSPLVNELIIDEISQVRCQFSSSTFLKQKNQQLSFNTFKALVKYAKTVHIMDANLTHGDIVWIQSMRRHANRTEIYWNQHLNLKGRGLQITNNKIDVIRKVEQNLTQNQKFFLACNGSTENLNVVANILRAHKPHAKLLVITSEDLDEEHIKVALDNPNCPENGFGAYDGVLTSPSIQSGISYDAVPVAGATGLFHSVYGMFSNYTSKSGDCAQMLNRIRHPINNSTLVSIEMTNHAVTNTTETELVNHLSANKAHILPEVQAVLSTANFELGNDLKKTFEMTGLFKLYVDNTVAGNKDKKYFLENFIENHALSGYLLEVFDGLSAFNETELERRKSLAKYKKKLSGVKAEIKTLKATVMANSILIDSAQRSKISEKFEKGVKVDKTQLEEMKKYDCLNTYEMKENITDPDWFKKYNTPKTMEIWRNQRWVLKHDTLQKAVDALKEKEVESNLNKLNGVMSNRTTDEQAIDRLAIDYIVNKSKYQKLNLMNSWLTTLGFEQLNSEESITAEALKANLVELHTSLCENLDNVVDILGKHKDKTATITKITPEDALFNKKLLGFINGSMKNVLGVSVIKSGQRATATYKLENQYMPSHWDMESDAARGDTADATSQQPIIKLLESTIDFRDMLPRDSPYDSDEEE